MSEDRLERALQEMRQEDVDAGDARGRAGARLGQRDERRRRRLCGVPAGLPRVPERRARRQPARPDGRPSQPLPRVPRLDGRDEGRTAGRSPCRSGPSSALGAMGKPGRGRRTASRGPLSRTRRHRRHDGSRRSAGHGRFRRRRPVPPAGGSARSRRRHRREGVGPHGPGSPRRVAARRRIDGGRQRANGAVRHRRLERPGAFTSSAATSSSRPPSSAAATCAC